MSVAVKKLEGVEGVTVSLEKSTAVVTLKADNKVTLAQLRTVIRQSGYPTRDAQVIARGRFVERGGTPVLDLLNGSVLELAARPDGAPADPVDVTGVSRESERKTDRLTVLTVKR